MTILDREAHLLVTVSRVEDIGSSYVLLSNISQSKNLKPWTPINKGDQVIQVILHGPTLLKRLKLLYVSLDTGLPCPRLLLSIITTTMFEAYISNDWNWSNLVDKTGNIIISFGDRFRIKLLINSLSKHYQVEET